MQNAARSDAVSGVFFYDQRKVNKTRSLAIAKLEKHPYLLEENPKY
jgi:hypothetical protein